MKLVEARLQRGDTKVFGINTHYERGCTIVHFCNSPFDQTVPVRASLVANEISDRGRMSARAITFSPHASWDAGGDQVPLGQGAKHSMPAGEFATYLGSADGIGAEVESVWRTFNSRCGRCSTTSAKLEIKCCAFSLSPQYLSSVRDKAAKHL